MFFLLLFFKYFTWIFLVIHLVTTSTTIPALYWGLKFVGLAEWWPLTRFVLYNLSFRLAFMPIFLTIGLIFFMLIGYISCLLVFMGKCFFLYSNSSKKKKGARMRSRISWKNKRREDRVGTNLICVLFFHNFLPCFCRFFIIHVNISWAYFLWKLKGSKLLFLDMEEKRILLINMKVKYRFMFSRESFQVSRVKVIFVGIKIESFSIGRTVLPMFF